MRYKVEDLTLLQYQWWYRDELANACEQHGVSVLELTKQLDELGAATGTLPWSVGQTVSSDHDRHRLPAGTVLQIGEPAVWSSHGLLEKYRTRWHPLLGAQRVIGHNHRPVIVHLPDGGTQDWFTAKPTEEDQDAVQHFIVQAYRMNMKLKHSHGWCETFDNILEERLNMNRRMAAIRATADGVRVGDLLSPGEVVTLPVGTLLGWTRNSDDQSKFYMRVSHAKNTAKTRRVYGWGPITTPNYSRSMTVVSIPSHQDRQQYWWHMQGLDIDLGNHPERWDRIPVGTVFSYCNNHYVIHADHTASTYVENERMRLFRSGQFARRDFGHDPTILIHAFPEQEYRS